MSIFDIASALVLLAALFGYLNLKFLKLPPTIGLMIIALVSSLAVILMDQITPSYHMRDIITEFIGRIDFNEALMKGMLGFLLFAGALHVNFDDLYERRFSIASLATGIPRFSGHTERLGKIHNLNLEVSNERRKRTEEVRQAV